VAKVMALDFAVLLLGAGLGFLLDAPLWGILAIAMISVIYVNTKI
jgi:hypothetical protein